MTDIRWVCLSDMHLGAENSILSHLPAGSATVDPGSPSPVLVELMKCLRVALATNLDERRPTLILNGDILELALADDNVAAMVFAGFIELACGGDRPLFDATVYFVPGNHDHHLWETARERQYAKYVSRLPESERFPPPWHVTRLYEKDPDETPEAELLNAVIASRGLGHVRVRVVYPNLGIASRDHERVIVIHHGHFTEPLYRLMSNLKATVFPQQPRGEDVWSWESDNFAWIDFFWSSLGRSGVAGLDVGLVYDMLQDSKALARLALNMTGLLTKRLPRLLRPVARFALILPTRYIAKQIAGRERANPDLLGRKTAAGLREYLAGPVRRQLERESPGAASQRRAVFVFGHTHKPFEREEQIDGFSSPVEIYNSGGWVVDTENTAQFQGGAVILIDEACGVASLRMYNQADEPSDYRVRLAEAGSDGDSELRSRLEGALDFGAAPWATFSAEVARSVDDRHRELPRIIQRGIAQT